MNLLPQVLLCLSYDDFNIRRYCGLFRGAV